VSVDYRLLHHFRVSQRRELASRGELSVLRPDEPSAGEPVTERRAKGDSPDASPALAEAPPAKADPAQAGRAQVLTHLLNEDR
jgi:hypothetical protein